MRPIFFTIPLGGLFASAGLWMLLSASAPQGQTFRNGTDPKHPVTPEMAAAAAKLARKDAADFTLKDTKGKSWNLKDLAKGKPLFVYFILEGCPCSTDAEPLFHLLHKRFEGKVNFAGIISSKQAKGAEWAKNHNTPYPVLCDPDMKTMKAYGAKNSVYSALITKDGKIVRLWPGYSVAVLQELNSEMALNSNVDEEPFDTLYAPQELSSGCPFDIS